MSVLNMVMTFKLRLKDEKMAATCRVEEECVRQTVACEALRERSLAS